MSITLQNENTAGRDLDPSKVVALSVANVDYSVYLPDQETDYIQRKIATEKMPYEIEMLDDIGSRLAPGDIVLDVGANIGNHTLYIAAVAGCRVVAFEPNLELAEALAHSLRLNGLSKQVAIKTIGLGRENTRGEFRTQIEDNLGAQSLEVGEGRITIKALDELDLQRPIKLIKVDVEGMELAVLEGGAALIAQDRPLIYVECMSVSEFKVIAKWMAGQNYTYWDTFNATPTHLFIPLEQTSLDQRIERLHYKEVIGSYQVDQQLQPLRANLASANQKYRDACQRIDALKAQISKSDSVTKAFEQQLADSQQVPAGLRVEVEREQQQVSAPQFTNQHPETALEQKRRNNEGVQREPALEHERELNALRRAFEHEQARAKQIEAELNAQIERRQLVEQRLIKTRASVTYQLGYRIKAGLTSLNGLARLPSSLIELYRQAGQKRKPHQNSQAATHSAPVEFLAPEHPPEAPVLLDTASEQNELLIGNLSSKQLKVACVMDDFTFGSYAPEANLLQLTPGNWRAELEGFKPELLFIESAWRGKAELWGSKVGHNASEVQQIVRWCKQHRVPTVFWNKEDPVHFDTFLATAKNFDCVFTTDLDCIHRYKAALGHNEVYFLPFACQPALHNPIERFERKDAFCFAGAYYVRYPERTRDLGNFMAQLTQFRPVEIYDRNYGKTDPNYQFPAEYQPFIVGTLKSSEIDCAYKGYNYAINLNSVKQSQTMFARRVYELLGCNTLTVSNYSRGIRLMFGDLVITTDSGEQMVRRLKQLASDTESTNKLRLAALRKVMQEHTYSQRLDYVVSKAMGKYQAQKLPSVAVLAFAQTSRQLEQLIASFSRQVLPDITLHVLLGDGVAAAQGTDIQVNYICSSEVTELTVKQVIGDVTWVAGMIADDYYGANYLLDLALASRYSHCVAFGKVEHFIGDTKDIQLRNLGRAYHKTAVLVLRSALVKAELVHSTELVTWLGDLATRSLHDEPMLAIDRYNYCRDAQGIDLSVVAEHVDDLNLDTGMTIQALQQMAEAITPAQQSVQLAELSIDQLVKVFGPCRSKQVRFTREEHSWVVSSTLGDGKHEYIYAASDLSLAQLGDVRKMHIDITLGLNIQLIMLFIDKSNQRISHVMLPANRNHLITIPPETAAVRLGWRVYASGVAEIKAIMRGHRDALPARIISQARHLVLTNNYPAYSDLYRNAFVHTRVQGYAAAGVKTDVFRFKEKELSHCEEFHGQDVFTGGANLLEKMLAGGQYKTVLVHFLSPPMWEVLSKYLNTVKVIVWLHGAEIHPWYRREFNYLNDSQREIAKIESEKRMKFWQDVLVPMHVNLHLVIVSQAFAKEITEDTGVTLAPTQYSIIHNPVDVQLFNYVEKPIEQRRKVLSIRPFASRQYANDLSVKAIIELSERADFDDIEFCIIGDGVLFDETLEPLRKFSNVTIEKRFLNHQQIAELHKEYGIFLCPTRWDSQGVSRDEAMASGLVAVTTAIAAVPEFADELCATLAPAEDHIALANAMAQLFDDEEQFRLKSRNAAERVRAQSAIAQTIAQEIQLFEQDRVSP